MKNRITQLFEEKKEDILSVFFTAGFPKLNDTITIAQQLEKSGVELIEIGIPFSDPIADGPTIQASNKIALENGMSVKLLLEHVKEIRKTVHLPIILMGYLNPVYQYGVEKFIREAKEAGADGLILPDLPLAEYENSYKNILDEQQMSFSFLISPTTSDDRIRKIDNLTNGFIYAVSSSSTTGTKEGFNGEQTAYFQKLKSLSLSNPFLIGFGVSNRETFSTVCQYASGAIIGSAFIKVLEKSTDLENDIQGFVQLIRNESIR
jgi:tryptophan synthase alpha chain